MKTRIVNFRATKEMIKDIKEILEKDGHYRNRTEIINEALRIFVRNYKNNIWTNSKNKVKKK